MTNTFLGRSLERLDYFENARPRSGFPRSRLELGHWEKGYLSVVESGDRRGRIKAGGICAIGRFWVQFLHLDMSEQGALRDPGIGEILYRRFLIDSVHLEWRDSIYMWCCRMEFCDVPLPTIVSVLEGPPFYEGVVQSG